jgi:2-(1,2-epoxy-1,2-dihydrophenyl)acetyl-CoA isomerase
MRHLLRDSWGAPLEQQLASESAAMQTCARTGDAREGLVAFVERRSPRFTGKR